MMSAGSGPPSIVSGLELKEAAADGSSEHVGTMKGGDVVDRRSPLRSPRSRKLAAGAGFVLLVLGALFISTEPTVEARERPTAQDIGAARELVRHLKAARGVDRGVRVTIDNRMLHGLAALTRDASGLDRIVAHVSGGVLAAEASIPLPFGLWINTSASATGQHQGFPDVRLKVGRVAFPEAAGRWCAELGRWLLRIKGATIPPLDELVREAKISERSVVTELALPVRTNLVGGLISAGGTRVDEQLVASIYCRMAAAQRKEPANALNQLVGATFAGAPRTGRETYGRAAFVALSLFVVGEVAEPLAPAAAKKAKACPRPSGTILLHDRPDLAKHWALSAALTSVLGAEAAGNLGEWKELDDSLANGSGFSFVDLAADRSGVALARRALASETSDATLEALRLASEEDLLPVELLQGPEGLSDMIFVDRFGSLDQEKYRAAVAWIDRKLAENQRH